MVGEKGSLRSFAAEDKTGALNEWVERAVAPRATLGRGCVSPNSGSEGTLLSAGRPEQAAGLSDPKPWVLAFSRPRCVRPMPRVVLPTQPHWLGPPLPATHGAPPRDHAGSGALRGDGFQTQQAWASRESQGQPVDRAGLKPGPSLQAALWTEFQGQAGAWDTRPQAEETPRGTPPGPSPSSHGPGGDAPTAVAPPRPEQTRKQESRLLLRR